MTIQERKDHLVQVGNFLSQFTRAGIEKNQTLQINDPFFAEMKEQIEMAIHYNGWFTMDNVLFSLEQWSQALQPENLNQWLQPYDLNLSNQKTVGIIMAGNIPMVGFHDFISVLLSGHKVLVKLSSNDKRLLPVIVKLLTSIEPRYKELIELTEGRMTNFDAVIATGSNNTARYFEYYFASKPSIIRKNRNSVAILTGQETETELTALGNDIFQYFGLGCRNVSKLYVPENYDFDAFYKALSPWQQLMNHAKYANNYDYNKAVYLMSEFKFLDNGFLILKEAREFGSPIATLFFQTYSSKLNLQELLEENRDQLQCIVGREEQEIKFGNSQQPQLWEYADDVDTLNFLVNL